MPSRASLLWPLWARAVAGLGIALVVVAAIVLLRRPGWNVSGPTTALHQLDGELFFIDAPDIVRVGPPRLVVVRLTGPAELVPHTCVQEGLPGPMAIDAWARHLRAPIVFNAGQFDASLRHLGWLKGRGTWLSRTRKPAWLGLLASGPQGPDAPGPEGRPMPLQPWGQIVDLQGLGGAEAERIAARFSSVVQSMMLVDEAAQVRVRTSTRAACRTVVAVDAAGRLLIIATEGAVTLHELARWLAHSELRIVRAMNLDGGVESQLSVATADMQLTFFGQYGSESSVMGARAGGVRTPLPAVVAVYPRREGPTSAVRLPVLPAAEATSPAAPAAAVSGP